MKTLKLLTLALLLPFFVCAQDTMMVHNNLIGKWALKKHLVQEPGRNKMRNIKNIDLNATYTFNADHTWSSTFWRKGVDRYLANGHWKLSPDGKQLMLSNEGKDARNTRIPSGEVALNIVDLTPKSLVITETLEGNTNQGRSYYIRSK